MGRSASKQGRQGPGRAGGTCAGWRAIGHSRGTLSSKRLVSERGARRAWGRALVKNRAQGSSLLLRCASKYLPKRNVPGEVSCVGGDTGCRGGGQGRTSRGAGPGVMCGGTRGAGERTHSARGGPEEGNWKGKIGRGKISQVAGGNRARRVRKGGRRQGRTSSVGRRWQGARAGCGGAPKSWEGWVGGWTGARVGG